MKQTKPGKAYSFGDVVIADVFYTDLPDSKRRPALVLFEERDNVVIMGITSNPEMEGIPLTVKEGAVRDSVIKTNYIFTISPGMVHKKLFQISGDKKKRVSDDLFRLVWGK